MPDIKAIEEILELSHKQVTKNVKIVTSEDVGDFVYHISTDKQKELVPNISRRAGYEEDNTLPRVHTSDTLLGCISGYTTFTVSADIRFRTKDDDFKGGYYIHVIPFTVGLRPSKKILPDVENVNEIWLITYDKSTVSFKPTNVEKMFITSVTRYNLKTYKQVIELFLETSIAIKLDKKTTVEPGLYKLKITSTSEKLDPFNSELEETIEVISKVNSTEYEGNKKLSAALLNYG